MSGLVLGLVGTDHHHFDRLVWWLDAAAERHPDHRFVVQHGESAAPGLAQGRAYLPHEELRALAAEADLVVTHGGPGTIVDARDAGHLPVCVPRDPGLGEHVDGHQLRFCEVVGGVGLVRPARTREEFDRVVDGVLLGELSSRRHDVGIDAARARRELAGELDEMLRDRSRGRMRRLVHLRRGSLGSV